MEKGGGGRRFDIIKTGAERWHFSYGRGGGRGKTFEMDIKPMQNLSNGHHAASCSLVSSDQH